MLLAWLLLLVHCRIMYTDVTTFNNRQIPSFQHPLICQRLAHVVNVVNVHTVVHTARPQISKLLADFDRGGDLRILLKSTDEGKDTPRVEHRVACFIGSVAGIVSTQTAKQVVRFVDEVSVTVSERCQH